MALFGARSVIKNTFYLQGDASGLVLVLKNQRDSHSLDHLRNMHRLWANNAIYSRRNLTKMLTSQHF
jgi:hypothetical protein